MKHAARGDRVRPGFLLGARVDWRVGQPGLDTVAVQRRRLGGVVGQRVALETPLRGFDERQRRHLFELTDAVLVGECQRGPLAERALEQRREGKVADDVFTDFARLQHLRVLARAGTRARHELLGDVRRRPALIPDRRHQRPDPAQPRLGPVADDHFTTRLNETVQRLAPHPPRVVRVFVILWLFNVRQRHRRTRDDLVRRPQRRLVPRGHPRHRRGSLVVLKRRRPSLAAEPNDSLIPRIQNVAADRHAVRDVLHALVLPHALKLFFEYELLDPRVEVRVVESLEHRVRRALRRRLRSLNVADGVLEVERRGVRRLSGISLIALTGLDTAHEPREGRADSLALRLAKRDSLAELLRPEFPFPLAQDVLNVAVARDAPRHEHPVHVVLAVRPFLLVKLHRAYVRRVTCMR